MALEIFEIATLQYDKFYFYHNENIPPQILYCIGYDCNMTICVGGTLHLGSHYLILCRFSRILSNMY